MLWWSGNGLPTVRIQLDLGDNMIRFKDICDVSSKQFSVETREGKNFEVSIFGLPDGINQILAVRRSNGEDVFIATLPVEVINALHEITG